jgi:hypothetical protein
MVSLPGPVPVWGHTLTYDVATQQVLRFGGSTTLLAIGAVSQTWLWDGLTWTEMTLQPAPIPRYDHAMVYDQARGEHFLFGGQDNAGYHLGDCWVY